LSSRKVRAGVSLDYTLVEALDTHAKNLSELNVDRSEIVNDILDDYFEWDGTT
jgi:metal-responsive CopG/Arc/MetJ family transcriptional regulator